MSWVCAWSFLLNPQVNSLLPQIWWWYPIDFVGIQCKIIGWYRKGPNKPTLGIPEATSVKAAWRHQLTQHCIALLSFPSSPSLLLFFPFFLPPLFFHSVIPHLCSAFLLPFYQLFLFLFFSFTFLHFCIFSPSSFPPTFLPAPLFLFQLLLYPLPFNTKIILILWLEGWESVV